jgi:hypothetical protein
MVERLLLAGLIDSEPPKLHETAKANALRVTATGAYYWSYLVRSFAYLDLIFVDTPIRDEALARELAKMAEATKESLGMREWIRLRIERLELFVGHLAAIEKEEMLLAAKKSGPYTTLLSSDIVNQIAREIDGIRIRTGA